MAPGPGQVKPGPTPPPSQKRAQDTSRTSTAARPTYGNSASSARATTQAAGDHRGTEKDSTDMAKLCRKGIAKPIVGHSPISTRAEPDTPRDRGPDRSNDPGKSTNPCSLDQYAHQGRRRRANRGGPSPASRNKQDGHAKGDRGGCTESQGNGRTIKRRDSTDDQCPTTTQR